MTASEALEEFTTHFIQVFESSTTNAEEKTKQLRKSIEGVLQRHNIDKDQSFILTRDSLPACKL